MTFNSQSCKNEQSFVLADRKQNKNILDLEAQAVIALPKKRKKSRGYSLLLPKVKPGQSEPEGGGGHCVLNGVLRGHFLVIKM